MEGVDSMLGTMMPGMDNSTCSMMSMSNVSSLAKYWPKQLAYICV